MRGEDRTGRRTAPWPARAAFGALTALLMTVLAWFPAPAQASAASPAATATAGHRHGSATATAHRPTVVSLTFDDGTAGQFAAAQAMHRYGIAGTFFIITGAVGAPNYMSLADLHQLAAYGDEIGAHTVSHLDLVATTAAEARRQVCASRDILTRWGFPVTSFAYPDGAANRQVEAIVAACGFDAARIATGLAGPGLPGLRRGGDHPARGPVRDPHPRRGGVHAPRWRTWSSRCCGCSGPAAAGCRWCSTTCARRRCGRAVHPRRHVRAHSCAGWPGSASHGVTVRDRAPGARRAGAADGRRCRPRGRTAS